MSFEGPKKNRYKEEKVEKFVEAISVADKIAGPENQELFYFCIAFYINKLGLDEKPPKWEDVKGPIGELALNKKIGRWPLLTGKEYSEMLEISSGKVKVMGKQYVLANATSLFVRENTKILGGNGDFSTDSFLDVLKKVLGNRVVKSVGAEQSLETEIYHSLALSLKTAFFSQLKDTSLEQIHEDVIPDLRIFKQKYASN